MYLVSKGACLVTLIDEKKNEQIIKELRPGEYFGEIALIYGCKRTATVKSLKYSTLAKLKKSDYQDILIEFPDLKKQLMEHIFSYKDRVKMFIMESLKKVEYFKDIDDEALHDIIYNLKAQKYNKDDIL